MHPSEVKQEFKVHLSAIRRRVFVCLSIVSCRQGFNLIMSWYKMQEGLKLAQIEEAHPTCQTNMIYQIIRWSPFLSISSISDSFQSWQTTTNSRVSKPKGWAQMVLWDHKHILFALLWKHCIFVIISRWLVSWPDITLLCLRSYVRTHSQGCERIVIAFIILKLWVIESRQV